MLGADGEHTARGGAARWKARKQPGPIEVGSDGFVVGAQGMAEPGMCEPQYGFPVFDTTDDRIRVWYFSATDQEYWPAVITGLGLDLNGRVHVDLNGRVHADLRYLLPDEESEES